MPSQKKIMIAAGEASGDLHGSNLIKAALNIDPHISFYGVCGEKMREAGAETLVESSHLSVVGIAEVLPNVGKIYKSLKFLKKTLEEDGPQLLVLIDFPDFNLRLAAHAKKLGIPILYYISPQVWAWRKGRAKKIARLVDAMAVVFPFEVPIYEKAGLKADFVGHPLIDAVNVVRSQDEIRQELSIRNDEKLIGLLPGSRGKEIKNLLPPMLETAEIMASRSAEFRFVLPVAHTVDAALINEYLPRYKVDVIVVRDMTYEVMKACDMAFIASGTATLEAAITGTPMVVVYKASMLTYMTGKLFVLNNISHFALPNIVAEKKIVPELLQDDANPARMVEEAFAILFGSGIGDRMKDELRCVREKLGGKGASERTAEILLKMINAN